MVRFAETLDAAPSINGALLPNVKAVMGGSLGGHLSFRLGRRSNSGLDFLSWRWRLASEQLLDSHQSFDVATAQLRSDSGARRRPRVPPVTAP